jgi:SAM-dependent methyltransferase
MITQKQIWNRKHREGEHAEYRDRPTAFGAAVEPRFPRQARILDLGCGVGGDAYFFARQGHQVLATDFSDVVLAQNKALLKHSGLRFAFQDIAEPFTLQEAGFDVVYAHLSLHYYDDATTRRIFADITRVLKPGGLLCFACKSPADKAFGQGKQLGPDMFVSESGHLRHFFTPAYARELLKPPFVIEALTESTDTYIQKVGGFIRCIAQKPF